MEDLRMVENMTNIQPATFRAELDFDVPELRNQANRLERDLTDEQRDIYNSVITAVKDNTPLSLFIVARGGCGKTYLLNTILKKVRSLNDQGSIALAMATTGIAANLLHIGRTFHSRLKAPLQLNITVQSTLAKVVQQSKLMIIDEAPMLDSYMLSALDRSLRDIWW